MVTMGTAPIKVLHCHPPYTPHRSVLVVPAGVLTLTLPSDLSVVILYVGVTVFSFWPFLLFLCLNVLFMYIYYYVICVFN